MGFECTHESWLDESYYITFSAVAVLAVPRTGLRPVAATLYGIGYI